MPAVAGYGAAIAVRVAFANAASVCRFLVDGFLHYSCRSYLEAFLHACCWPDMVQAALKEAPFCFRLGVQTLRFARCTFSHFMALFEPGLPFVESFVAHVKAWQSFFGHEATHTLNPISYVRARAPPRSKCKGCGTATDQVLLN